MCDTLLRRAADHIRYLAGPPVTWDADSPDWDTWEVHEQDRHGWWSRLIGRTRRPTRALHIATWDPRTAHLVADWLEDHADEHDTYDCMWEEDACAALKAARALMKEN